MINKLTMQNHTEEKPIPRISIAVKTMVTFLVFRVVAYCCEKIAFDNLSLNGKFIAIPADNTVGHVVDILVPPLGQKIGHRF